MRFSARQPLKPVRRTISEWKLAKVFPPGDYLRDELAARGWTQKQFARILGRPLQFVNQIINGHKRITEQTALELAAALGTTAMVWLNLEVSYRLHRAKAPSPAIARRARQASAA